MDEMQEFLGLMERRIRAIRMHQELDPIDLKEKRIIAVRHYLLQLQLELAEARFGPSAVPRTEG